MQAPTEGADPLAHDPHEVELHEAMSAPEGRHHIRQQAHQARAPEEPAQETQSADRAVSPGVLRRPMSIRYEPVVDAALVTLTLAS